MADISERSHRDSEWAVRTAHPMATEGQHEIVQEKAQKMVSEISKPPRKKKVIRGGNYWKFYGIL